jgi:hypothetical protein
MSKSIKINNIIIKGNFYSGLSVGLKKSEIEKIIGNAFKDPDIVTPDLNLYYIVLDTGLILSVIFDDEDVCFKIDLNIGENRNINLFVELDQGAIVEMNEFTTFDNIVTIFSNLNIVWEFDWKNVYMQTVCIRLGNGLRLFYAFGNKSENDYGLFSINSFLETHKFFISERV